MLSFTGSLRVFVALDPIDMRKGFEGLYAAVGEKLKADVRSGALFALPSFLKASSMAVSLRSAHQQEAHTFEGALLGQDGAVVDDKAFGTGAKRRWPAAGCPVGVSEAKQKGTFSWPRSVEPQATSISLAPGAFAMLTDGIDMHEATLRPWYQRD